MAVRQGKRRREPLSQRLGITSPAQRNASVALGAVAIVGAIFYGVVGDQTVNNGLDSGGVWAMVIGGSALWALAWWLVSRAPLRVALLAVVIGGAMFRAVLVPLPLALSSDANRYIWDGRVQAAGINPYSHAPEDPAVESLRDDAIWPKINRKPVHTIYPPAAQATFYAANRLGLRTPTGWKALTALADMGAVLLLIRALRAAGRDQRWALIYAFNPLPVLAFGLAGHLDSFTVLTVMAATLAWSRGRCRRVGGWLGLAASFKLFPLLLVAAFVRPRDGQWRWHSAFATGTAAVAVLVLGYLPYLSARGGVLGYLTTGYLAEEGYQSANRFKLVRALGLDATYVVPIVAIAVLIAVLRSHRPAPTRGAWLLGGAMVLTVPFGWYATPLIALAVAGGAGWAWQWFAIALYSGYLVVFFGPDGVFLSTPIRVMAAGTIVVLALLSTRWEWARHAVRWRAPDASDDEPATPAATVPQPEPVG